jgi:hypothetical protein
LVRRLEIDLLFSGSGKTGSQRYATNLSHLLTHAKSSLQTLILTADARPFTTSSSSSLDVKQFMASLTTLSSNPHFQAALSALPLENVGVRFEFEEMWFDFKVEKEALMNGGLVWLAGQVLVKRVEVGLGVCADEIEGVELMEGEGEGEGEQGMEIDVEGKEAVDVEEEIGEEREKWW